MRERLAHTRAQSSKELIVVHIDTPRHVELHGGFDNNIPPLLVPQCPPNLGRRVPNFVRAANNVKLGKCLCERIRPRPRQAHLHKFYTPPTRSVVWFVFMCCGTDAD